ncbi:histidinol-phosphate transaminase [Kovacikia minuta CCNUW1]|uniref:histidinol-phosphate transaminase n=1 Tax=Kovacikia minuta TaxID=2931930 RepID=UPI001CCD9B54|nr:histidinol-phosphate transaminase [Kovacikia minuta]UBF25128.1 histidinol-phosphate transaminase [Kovacikia minuta CCNUW1]
MLPFIRLDLAQLTAYAPHSEGDLTAPVLPFALTKADQSDRLDTNESPFDLPDTLKQVLAQAYQERIEANRYPDGGHIALKRAIAEYVNESASLPQNQVNQAHISIGNGSDELIRSLLIATCLRGEGSILVAEPTFSMYAILARTLGILVAAVERSSVNFAIDLNAAEAAIRQIQAPPVRVVFVVHPNSPTGNALTDAEISWLRSLPEHILVVIDEAYFEFSQRTLVEEVLQRHNWVILRTFSKAFRLAAHRVGYAIAHPDLIAILEKVRLPYNLPTFSQLAALTALTHRQQILRTIPQMIEQRTQLTQKLTQHPALQVWSSTANFVFFRLHKEWSDKPDFLLHRICATLKSQGTLIRQTGDGIRITIGNEEENTRTFHRLKAALDQYL